MSELGLLILYDTETVSNPNNQAGKQQKLDHIHSNFHNRTANCPIDYPKQFQSYRPRK